MILFLYFIVLLNCTHTVMPAARDDSDINTSLTTSSVLSSPLMQLATPSLLDLDTEITPLVAHACYKHHESELGKSPEELNAQLKHILKQSHNTKRFRSKLVALFFAGAQNKKIYNENRLLTDTIFMDDIQLAHYLFENQLAGSANESYAGAPLLWHCKSVAMAQLLLAHGADVNARDALGRNILHYVSNTFYSLLPPLKRIALICFYYAQRPPLLNATNNYGETPLASIYGKRSFTWQRMTCVHTLLNLGTDTTIKPTAGSSSEGKTFHELVIANADKKSLGAHGKQYTLDLAAYIEILPKIRSSLRSSLFEQLWNQWHDQLDSDDLQPKKQRRI